MKLRTIIYFAAFMLMMCACGKQSLKGTWVSESIIEDNFQATITLDLLDNNDAKETLNGVVSQYDEDWEATIDISFTATAEGKWSLKGDKLELTDMKNPDVTIGKITSPDLDGDDTELFESIMNDEVVSAGLSKMIEDGYDSEFNGTFKILEHNGNTLKLIDESDVIITFHKQ